MQALQLLHGTLRHQQGAWFLPEQDPGAAVTDRAQSCSGFGNSIWMPNVPVVESTARSTTPTLPSCGYTVPSESVSWMPAARGASPMRPDARRATFIVGFGHAAREQNRIDLRDREQRVLAATHETAGFDRWCR